MALNQNQAVGIANLGSSSHSFSTPGNGSAKRYPQKPPVRPSGVSLTHMTSPVRTMEINPAARKKKQKLPVKLLQDQVATILPESTLYA
ncbi:hypothetical protein ACFX15_022080 [Malus domestica]